MALAATDAQGMQREGNIAAGQFREGDSLEVPMQLNPGKCYTVLAVGAGIQEMHISLMSATPIPGQFQEVARDGGGGAQATLGGKGNCYKWPWPVGAQGKYVMKATRGSGVAAGALYVK
jgi:hypothetical protein